MLSLRYIHPDKCMAFRYNLLIVSISTALCMIAGAVGMYGQSHLELTSGAGATIRNSPRYPRMGAAYNAELAFAPHIKPSSLFARYFGGVRIWHGLSYHSFGNDGVLGVGFGYIPSIEKQIVTRAKWSLGFRLGIGGAYVTRAYDPVTQPDNRILGSNVHFMGKMKFVGAFKLSSHWSAVANVGISHFSNGGFNPPNVGINDGWATLGLRYTFEKPSAADTSVVKPFVKNKKLRLSLRYAIGLHKSDYWNSDIYAHTLHFALEKRMAAVSLLKVGLESTFSPALVREQELLGKNMGNESLQSTRFAAIIGHELFIGRLGLLTEGGVFLNGHYKQTSPFMSRIGLNLHAINPLTQPKHNVSVGVFARTYFGLAEMVEVAVTIR